MEVNSKESSPVKMYVGGSIILLAIVVGVFFLFLRQNKSVAAERANRVELQKEGPLVKVAHATTSGNVHELILIGEVRPFRSVILYAKTSGYLEKIEVDK